MVFVHAGTGAYNYEVTVTVGNRSRRFTLEPGTNRNYQASGTGPWSIAIENASARGKGSGSAKIVRSPKSVVVAYGPEPKIKVTTMA